MDRKIEDSRDGIRREMELLYSRNIQALNVREGPSFSTLPPPLYSDSRFRLNFQEANQNQSKQEKQASPENPPPERDVDAFRDIHLQQMKKKVSGAQRFAVPPVLKRRLLTKLSCRRRNGNPGCRKCRLSTLRRRTR